MTTQTSPFEILQKIDPKFLQYNQTPLVGKELFSLDDLAAQLSQKFGFKQARLQTDPPIWIEGEEELNQQLPMQQVPLQLMGLEGEIIWQTSKQDMNALAGHILGLKSQAAAEAEPELVASLYRFFLLETLHGIQSLVGEKKILPRLLERESALSGPYLKVPAALFIEETKLGGSLLLSPQFLNSWRHFCAAATQATAPSISSQTPVTCHLEIGHTALSLTQIQALSLGDFLLLDRCSYLADKGKSSVVLTLFGKPFFRASLNEGQLKILEFPIFQEDRSPMNAKDPSQLDPFDDDEDEDEDDDDFDLDTEIEDDEDDEDLEDSDLEESELEESELEESEFDESEIEKRSSPAMRHQENQRESQHLAQAPKGAAKREVHAKTQEKPTSIASLPLEVVVEAGRIQLPIQKVLDLQQGSLLELNVKPEEGVDLTVNGKLIGRGELLMIGEMIGVRILELGQQTPAVKEPSQEEAAEKPAALRSKAGQKAAQKLAGEEKQKAGEEVEPLPEEAKAAPKKAPRKSAKDKENLKEHLKENLKENADL